MSVAASAVLTVPTVISANPAAANERPGILFIEIPAKIHFLAF